MTHVHQGLLRLTGHSKSHVQHIFPEMNIPEKRVPYTYSAVHFTSGPLKGETACVLPKMKKKYKK